MPTDIRLPFRSAAGLLLGLVLATTLTLTASAPAGASASTSERVSSRPTARALVQRSLEDQVLELTNVQRRANGCGDLKPSARLRVSARRHTKEMAAAGQMSHQLPGEPYFATRITRAGYKKWRQVAENVARGYSGPTAVVDAWMASPGHRRNILNCNLRDLGVGVVLQDDQLWWTQNFGRR